MPSSTFFVLHDLTHFAVETTLGLREAFYGLIAGGRDIDSFADREPGTRKARTLPPEALLAEIVVGTFDLERAAGPLGNEELTRLVDTKCAESNLPLSDLTPEQLDAVRKKRDELFARWRTLGSGETLELVF